MNFAQDMKLLLRQAKKSQVLWWSFLVWFFLCFVVLVCVVGSFPPIPSHRKHTNAPNPTSIQ